MPPRLLRPLSLSLIVLTLAGIGLLGARDTLARPQVADFTATRSPREAAAIVREAQARDAALRQSLSPQLAVDASRLPFTPTVYFEQSGHHLSNRAGFLDYWRANGQMVIFGYPITEEIVENGLIVQYFERARFEYHPGGAGAAGQVRLGLIGSETAAIGYAPFARVEEPPSGSRYFPETGHTIWGEFRTFWQKRGGLEIFGFPISEEFNENGNGRVVQLFERAKLEYYPEDMSGFFRSAERANGFNLNTLFEVQVSDLGRQLAITKGYNLSPVPRLPAVATWTPALWQRHIEVNLSTQQLVAYEGDLRVYSAPVATGKDGFNTPVGEYAIYDRYAMQTMIGSGGGETWNVPNIPWVMYVVGGVALHGTYWHDAHGSGVRMSHGCINLRIDDAEWLYRWADLGTTVQISY
jgi:L,D-transpeptidase catalytic domain